MQHVETYEIPQFKEACERVASGYSPKITFIVVQKRINHKFFKFIRDKPAAESYVSIVLDRWTVNIFIIILSV